MSQEDLNQISDFISSTAQNFILQQVSQKEITDLDIKVELSYKEELDVDVIIDISFDELSKSDQDLADNAVDYSLEALETFLDDNFRT